MTLSTPGFKIIAHRGGAVRKDEENSWGAIARSLELGAYGVEVDVRETHDGVLVLHHDSMVGDGEIPYASIADLTLSALNEIRDRDGLRPVLTLPELISRYPSDRVLLLDLKLETFPKKLKEILCETHSQFILGVRNQHQLRRAAEIANKDQILVFPKVPMAANRLYHIGATLIRLWEAWAEPERIELCHRLGFKVWIMAGEKGNAGVISETRIRRVLNMGADGILVNDVRLAVSCIKGTS